MGRLDGPGLKSAPPACATRRLLLSRPPCAVQVVKLSLLESLAELLGLEPAAAARQLLGMTPEERTQLRRRLAEADAQPPMVGSSGNGSSIS